MMADKAQHDPNDRSWIPGVLGDLNDRGVALVPTNRGNVRASQPHRTSQMQQATKPTPQMGDTSGDRNAQAS